MWRYNLIEVLQEIETPTTPRYSSYVMCLHPLHSRSVALPASVVMLDLLDSTKFCISYPPSIFSEKVPKRAITSTFGSSRFRATASPCEWRAGITTNFSGGASTGLAGTA
ncbi:unnamed protein product [Amoebophrya sp. A120]|nr:unnamed protein product [Amoebophrya sp. A120]|eukprot:GSA120T00026248001.1